MVASMPATLREAVTCLHEVRREQKQLKVEFLLDVQIYLWSKMLYNTQKIFPSYIEQWSLVHLKISQQTSGGNP